MLSFCYMLSIVRIWSLVSVANAHLLAIGQSGPAMQHQSGPAVQHQSGPAVQHQSGPAMQHQSGQALQHQNGKAVQQCCRAWMVTVLFGHTDCGCPRCFLPFTSLEMYASDRACPSHSHRMWDMCKSWAVYLTTCGMRPWYKYRLI